MLRWRRLQAVWTSWMVGGGQQDQKSSADHGGYCGEAGPLSAVLFMPRPREPGDLHAQLDGGPWSTDGTGATPGGGSPQYLFGWAERRVRPSLPRWVMPFSTGSPTRSPLRVGHELRVGQGRAEESAGPLPYGARPGRMAWHAVQNFECPSRHSRALAVGSSRWPHGAVSAFPPTVQGPGGRPRGWRLCPQNGGTGRCYLLESVGPVYSDHGFARPTLTLARDRAPRGQAPGTSSSDAGRMESVVEEAEVERPGGSDASESVTPRACMEQPADVRAAHAEGVVEPEAEEQPGGLNASESDTPRACTERGR